MICLDMGNEPVMTTIAYRSERHKTEPCDRMHVIYQNEDPTAGAKGILNSFVVGRTTQGHMLRMIALDQWERVTDEKDLHCFQSHFDNRDRSEAQGKARSNL